MFNPEKSITSQLLELHEDVASLQGKFVSIYKQSYFKFNDKMAKLPITESTPVRCRSGNIWRVLMYAPTDDRRTHPYFTLVLFYGNPDEPDMLLCEQGVNGSPFYHISPHCVKRFGTRYIAKTGVSMTYKTMCEMIAMAFYPLAFTMEFGALMAVSRLGIFLGVMETVCMIQIKTFLSDGDLYSNQLATIRADIKYVNDMYLGLAKAHAVMKNDNDKYPYQVHDFVKKFVYYVIMAFTVMGKHESNRRKLELLRDTFLAGKNDYFNSLGKKTQQKILQCMYKVLSLPAEKDDIAILQAVHGLYRD